MKFPNTTGKPYVKIDGRTGAFSLSCPDGDPEIFDMSGRLLDLDLNGAVQGWLKLDVGGADWMPLDEHDGWSSTPRPSTDHMPGVSIDLMCRDWPDPKVRQLRGSSKAITGFIANVALGASDVPIGKAVRIRMRGAKVVKFGKGSSVNLTFEVAPMSHWPDSADFDQHREAPDNGDSFKDMPEDLPSATDDAASAWQ